MQLHEFLRSRRSVRRLKPDAVNRSAIERILATAASAPSAHNRQPWRFAVVDTAGRRSALATAMAQAYAVDLAADGMPRDQVEALINKSTERIVSAPLLIVLCMDMSDMDRYPDARRADAERIMGLQSTSNAGMLALLAAHADGLGGVWNCAPLFAPHAVSAALELPDTWEPQAMLIIGVPADLPSPRPRKEMESISRYL